MKKQEKKTRVTLQQVAEHAGVSRATASLIVRGSSQVSKETRDKVLASMKQLGYVYDRIAANLRSRHSSTVGLIISEISNPFFAELLVGVHNALDREGYTVILGTTFEDVEKQDQLISMMLESRVGGVIMTPVSGSSNDVIERLGQWDIPVVFFAKELKGDHYDYVGVDNARGAKMAVEYLIRQGHRRIAYLGGPADSSARSTRVAAYRQALLEAGLEAEDSLQVTSPSTREGGVEAARQILRLPNQPTAALCYNDIVALGVLVGLKEEKVRPGKDFTVVGFDNIKEAEFSEPRLTTVSAFPDLVGSNAADLLHQRMKGMDKEPQRIILEPKLIIRDS